MRLNDVSVLVNHGVNDDDTLNSRLFRESGISWVGPADRPRRLQIATYPDDSLHRRRRWHGGPSSSGDAPEHAARLTSRYAARNAADYADGLIRRFGFPDDGHALRDHCGRGQLAGLHEL